MKLWFIGLAIFFISPNIYAETITIAGSTTVQKYIELAAQAYQEKHPEVSFLISAGGSTHGYALTKTHRVHLGMMSRDMTQNEIDVAADISPHVIGYDAVAPVVSDEIFHPGGVNKISMDDLAAIYQGQIRNWNEVGGPEKPILIIDKELHRGTRYVFAEKVLGSAIAPAPESAIILEDNDDVRNLIQASDQALGYISFSYADEHVHLLPIAVSGKAIEPNADNIKSGSYPLARKLYLLSLKETPAYVQSFIDFVLSPDGQAIMRQTGYISNLEK